MTCHTCGKPLPPGSNYCMNCGVSLRENSSITLPFGGENRVITCMFADIAGFTGMSLRLPPEELVTGMNLFFEIVSDSVNEQGGIINKFIGDCALVVFGAPVAHENDPERAVLAAAGIQNRLEATNLRATIGINTGRVFFGIVGNSARSQIDVYGAAINIAQRLQGTAGPGDIIIGEATRNSLPDGPYYRELSGLELKGMDSPVTAYSVQYRDMPLNTWTGISQSLIFVGRKKETSGFRKILKKPSLTVIRGETGIGKTTLALEFGKIATEAGYRVHLFRCDSLHEFVSFGIVHELISVLLTERKSSGTCSAWEDNLKRILPEEYTLFLPVLKILQGAGCETGLSPIEQPETGEFRTLLSTLVKKLLYAANSSAPLLIIIEDLIWCDRPSLQMLIPILLAGEETGIRSVCTWRRNKDPEQPDIMAGESTVPGLSIDLSPFGITEISEYAAEFFHLSEFDERLAEVIMDKTEGNPLFIRELLRNAPEKDTDRTTFLKSLAEVPDSVQALLITRYDTLSEKEKSVLRAASVLGTNFTRDDLEVCVENPLSALFSLVEKEIIIREGAGSQGPYRFRHSLMRESVYATLLTKHKKELHVLAVEYLESILSESVDDMRIEELARHSAAIGDRDRILTYSSMAGDRAYRLSALNEASIHYRTCLEAAETREQRADVLIKLANVEIGLYNADSVISLIEDWLKNCRDLREENVLLKVHVLHSKALYLKLLDDKSYSSEIRRTLDEGEKLAEKLNSTEDLFRILKVRLDLYDFEDVYDRVYSETIQKLLTLIGRLKGTVLEIDARLLLFRVRPTETESMLKLIRDAEERDDPVQLIDLYFQTGWTKFGYHPLHYSVEIADKAIKQCKRIMVKPYMYPTIKAIGLAMMGRFSESEESLSHEITGEDNPFTTCFQKFGKAMLYLCCEKWDDASEEFISIVPTAAELDRSWMKYWAIEMAASALARAGKYEDIRPMVMKFEPGSTSRIDLAHLEINSAVKNREKFVGLYEKALINHKDHALFYKLEIMDAGCRGFLEFGMNNNAAETAEKALEICGYLGYKPAAERFRRYLASARQTGNERQNGE